VAFIFVAVAAWSAADDRTFLILTFSTGIQRKSGEIVVESSFQR
jgi:hypothetical protein